jgi:hypothetical protein
MNFEVYVLASFVRSLHRDSVLKKYVDYDRRNLVMNWPLLGEAGPNYGLVGIMHR